MRRMPRQRNSLHLLRTMMLLGALVAMLSVHVAGAATFTVTDTSDDPADTGSLRYAVNHYADGDSITFAPGVTGTILLANGTLTLARSVTITGPGAGVLAIDGNNAATVLVVNSGITATISGLTIQHGKTPANGISAGGIANSGGSVTLVGVSVMNNAGSGVSNYPAGANIATLAMTNCVVSGNVSSDVGGGIANDGTLTVANSTVSGNSASGNGGGIDNTGMSVTLTNVTVSGNTTTNNGGGIDSLAGALTLTGSTVSGNTGSSGGGISMDGVMLTITDTTITDTIGTGLFVFGGAATFTSGTIARSTSDGMQVGAGAQGRATVTNSTISNNGGYGLFVEGGTGTAATVTDSTISGNNGAFVTNSGFARLTLVGDTVAGNGFINSAGNLVTGSTIFADPFTAIGPVTDNDDNLITNTSGVSGFTAPHDLLNVNPLLGPLANNGGPTQTMALQSGSPALDRIPPASCAVATDQRGVARPQGPGCDIGAFEREAPAALPPTRPVAPTTAATPAPIPPTPTAPTPPPGTPTPNPRPPSR